MRSRHCGRDKADRGNPLPVPPRWLLLPLRGNLPPGNPLPRHLQSAFPRKTAIHPPNGAGHFLQPEDGRTAPPERIELPGGAFIKGRRGSACCFSFPAVAAAAAGTSGAAAAGTAATAALAAPAVPDQRPSGQSSEAGDHNQNKNRSQVHKLTPLRNPQPAGCWSRPCSPCAPADRPGRPAAPPPQP